MKRPRPTEGHQREVPRIVAAFDRNDPDRADHVVIGYRENATGRGLYSQSERPRHVPFNRAARRLRIEFHAACE